MQAVGITYQAIWERINQISWTSRVTRDKAVCFVQSLIRKRHMENTDPLEYTDMAYVYFLQKINSKYREVMKPLMTAGIIEHTGYFRPGYHSDSGDYIKGQCLSYRINPRLLGDDVVKIVYQDKKRYQRNRDEVTMTSKQILRQLRIPDLNSKQLVMFVKRALTDERIMKKLKIGDQIEDEMVMLKSRERFKQMIDDECVMVNDGSTYSQDLNQNQNDKGGKNDGRVLNDKWVVRHVRRDSIKLRKRVLIKDGKYCYIDYLDRYIKRKRRHLTQAYCDQLLRIKHRQVYADRNETNLRLDSNVTNLKSDFIGLLSIDDQRLTQVDLKNSQFRFFIMLMEQCERQMLFGKTSGEFPMTKFSVVQTAKKGDKLEKDKEGRIYGRQVTLLSTLLAKNCVQNADSTPSFTADYKLFKKLGKTGEFYEYIQKIYWQETGREISRSEAKKLMFTVAFSSYRYCPEGKKVLKKHFPSVIQLIDEFKKGMIQDYAQDTAYTDDQARDKGNASFAVMLQQTESLVFIDRILAQCHKRKIKALSKHDSILCRVCDKHQVTKIICRVLNQLFGRFSYSLDIDGQVFEHRKKRKTRMQRFVNQFVSTLFGMANQANAPPKVRKRNEAYLQLSQVGETCVKEIKVVSDPRATGSTMSQREEEIMKIRNPKIRELKRRFGV